MNIKVIEISDNKFKIIKNWSNNQSSIIVTKQEVADLVDILVDIQNSKWYTLNMEQKENWNVTCSNIKTDWYFVTILLLMAILGLMIYYMAQHINTQAERIDRLELESFVIKEAILPLPRKQEAEKYSLFEAMGIDKDGNDTEREWTY